MNRALWQQLAHERLADAQALIDKQRWSAAYYLAGYAVECGLKACILVRVSAAPEVIFAEGQRKFSESCWKHDPETLLVAADLKLLRDADLATDAVRKANWATLGAWDETARYAQWTEIQARELFNAVNDPQHGVLEWITQHW